MESQPQNPEFRYNPENFHPWSNGTDGITQQANDLKIMLYQCRGDVMTSPTAHYRKLLITGNCSIQKTAQYRKLLNTEKIKQTSKSMIRSTLKFIG